MPSANSEVHHHRRNKASAFAQLPPQPLRVAEVLATVYPVTPQRLLAICQRLGLSNAKSGFSAHSLSRVLDRLQAAGICNHDGGRVLCDSTSATQLLRQIKPSRLRDVATVARRELAEPNGRYFRTYADAIRHLRVAYFLGDRTECHTHLAICERYFPGQLLAAHPFAQFHTPFELDRLASLPDDEQSAVIAALGQRLRHALVLEPAFVDFLNAQHRNDSNHAAQARLILADLAILQQRFQDADALLQQLPKGAERSCRFATLAFLQGDGAAAIDGFADGLKDIRRQTRKRNVFYRDWCGVFYPLALLWRELPEDLDLARDLCKLATAHHELPNTIRAVENVRRQRYEAASNRTTLLRSLERWQPDTAMDALFKGLTFRWLNGEPDRGSYRQLGEWNERAQQAGATLLSSELTALLRDAEYVPANLPASACPLLNLFAERQPWQHQLRALRDLAKQGNDTSHNDATHRLVWQLHEDPISGWSLSPVRQRLSKNSWSVGRVVPLKNLHTNNGSMPELTELDRRICACIEPVSRTVRGSQRTGYQLDMERALTALAGHPLVFWKENPTLQIDVVKARPELVISEVGGNVELMLTPRLEPGHSIAVTVDTPQRVRVLEIQPEHRKLARILAKGLQVPQSNKQQVIDIAASLSPWVDVDTHIHGIAHSVATVPNDGTPRFRLRPHGQGLRVELLMRPFGDDGPAFVPSEGGSTVFATLAGRQVQCVRHLAGELSTANTVVAACPALAPFADSTFAWTIANADDCLTFLLEARALGDAVILEWPEGETFRVSAPLSMDAVTVQTRRVKAWFEVSGQVQVDSDLLVGLHELFDAAERDSGRFVQLDSGLYLALTENFRRQIDGLRLLSERQRRGRKLHPLAAIAAAELLTDAEAKDDGGDWQAQLDRLTSAPVEDAVPSTFRATMRPYQIEGYRWLMRMGHWGFGTCLADDMGLGKTIQALAMLVAQAPQGPTLVVAPTSALWNWQQEARRFAPTLNVHTLANKQRASQVAELGPFDVLLCSYGLLQHESALLTDKTWRTAVLDEAQAIKNPGSKRAQTAAKLQAHIRVALTGTPIENHLHELWSLFRFLNPGLLGGLKRFQKLYTVPIEEQGNVERQRELSRLVRPFILRRSKAKVLDDLPSRTEVTLNVSMSRQEQTLYEALRTHALTRCEHESAQGQRARVLAEITRLRRACSHPTLVVDRPIRSSKHDVLEEIIADLRAGGHKALIFSQFVDHLRLLSTTLEQQGISHQYLDGSTPANERQKQIMAFQAGEGDFFLISLRAGGVGLNLTAADYVIHMEPWWNPAVERQASDRAHRLGQTRPVTIYRLIMSGSIEEKILALHEEKRELAEQLLAGAETSGHVSIEELMGLIRG